MSVQRYVAPTRIVSVQPDQPRYSVVEDRRMAATKSSPGWYPDPYNRADGQRWWDGSQWSERRTRGGSSPGRTREYKAAALLAILAALATVVLLALFL